MNKTKSFFVQLISIFFIVLFSYAAFSKIADFENFQIQLAQSPLLSSYAGFVSYAVIVIELLICWMLIIPKYKIAGLHASCGLMTAFTIYIHLILNYSDFIPCSCGGILEDMTWTTHLIFNIVCVILSVLAVLLSNTTTFIGDRNDLLNEKYSEGWTQANIHRRKSVILVLSEISGSALLIVILFISSEHQMKKENNFIRRFPQHPLKEEGRYQLEVNSYYFAGQGTKLIYLANTTSPLLFSAFNKNLSERKDSYIQPPIDDVFFKSPRVQIKGYHFYLFDGSIPVIYRGRIADRNPKKIIGQEAYFNQLAIIDSSSFAVRTITGDPKHFALGSLAENKKPHFILNDQLLNSNVQSLFETDGSLIKDQFTGDLVYTYAYQNKFEVIKEDFKTIRQFNTIDTTKITPLQVQVLKNGDKRLKTPPPKVNGKSVAHRGILFIESKAMGKFESKELWKNTAVLDMYTTSRQEYLGSLRIYYRGSSKLSDILITDDYLYAIVGSELICYRLAKSVTRNFQKGKAENL